ncbi:MAG: TolC family protein [Deltaproteobacteria bacterium]|nr:TolC family protein [Deltaproteobacteria bacterium]
MQKRYFLLFILVIGLFGCVSYQVKPLNTQPTLLHKVPHLIIDTKRLPLPELAAHPFNPDDGMDMTEVTILAVVNNPALKIARDEKGIAEAQLMTAGILPNPQITAGIDHPTNGGPGSMDAFNFGLSYDINKLITRNAAIDAARANKLRIDLTVLWQEWQVVQQARLLFVKSLEQDKLMHLLQAYRAIAASLYQHAQQALQDGNLTMDTMSAYMAALQNINSRINNLQRQISKTRHDLNALLGLSPEVNLKLVGDANLPGLDQEKIKTYIAGLPQRRPDLLALQAGYASQEQRFRQAILAQFPALNIGLTRARDTSGIYTSGFGITLNLPIFNRNQGNIAIEKATRKRLYDEYQARLNAAYGQINSLMTQLKLVTRQYDGIKSTLPEMEAAVKHAKEALDAGNIDATTYTNLYAALLDKRMEAITLEQTILEERVALQTLIGSELPMQVTTAEIKLTGGD